MPETRKVRFIECAATPRGAYMPGVEYEIDPAEAKRFCDAGVCEAVGWNPGPPAPRPAPVAPTPRAMAGGGPAPSAPDTGGKFMLKPGSKAKPRKHIGPFDNQDAAELYAEEYELEEHEAVPIEGYDKKLHDPETIAEEL